MIIRCTGLCSARPPRCTVCRSTCLSTKNTGIRWFKEKSVFEPGSHNPTLLSCCKNCRVAGTKFNIRNQNGVPPNIRADEYKILVSVSAKANNENFMRKNHIFKSICIYGQPTEDYQLITYLINQIMNHKFRYSWWGSPFILFDKLSNCSV